MELSIPVPPTNVTVVPFVISSDPVSASANQTGLLKFIVFVFTAVTCPVEFVVIESIAVKLDPKFGLLDEVVLFLAVLSWVITKVGPEIVLVVMYVLPAKSTVFPLFTV